MLLLALRAVALVAAALLLTACAATGRDAVAAPASPPVAEAAAVHGPAHHLRALARLTRRHGDTRVAGSPGYTAAVRYVARTLRAAGYRVRRQPVTFPYAEVRRPSRMWIGGERLRLGRDFRTMEFTGGGDVTGAVRPVDVRFGRPSTSGCEARDFPALEPGTIVLLQRGGCTLRDKALNAQRAGAGAVLIANEGRNGLTRAFSGSLAAPGADVPVLTLSTATGRRLLRAPARPVRVRVDAISERRTADNVIASAPGAGPVLMAGAHLDSVAAGPGINDNASGVAALLAIAERRRGERGLRFGFWTAEELGLYGSKRYVASLRRGERARIAGYVNLDMVASPNPLPEVYGRGWVRPRLEAAVRAVGLRPVPTRIGDYSDHAPFAKAGIPVGGLHTGAFEKAPNGRPHDPCYHERCDDLSNVDWPMLRDLTDAADRALRAGPP